MKYGALSTVDGLLDVSGYMVGEDVVIVWTEQGGPEVSAPAELKGFGSNLVRQTMEDQLSGSVTYDWTKSGALITLRISGKRILD